MAIYTMCPVIEVGILEDEIKAQFGVDVKGELSNILFYDSYMDDCYKSYYFKDDIEYKYSWQNEEHVRICNLVNAYLRDILPNYTHVFIDISW